MDTDTTVKTITVADWNGKDKQITRADFITTWTKHVGELRAINYDRDWCTEVARMQEIVEAEVSREFDRLYEAQNKES